ncbi:LysR family transcriptional regulator [Pendulispora brunnea]|uniref:LysR family transcriptional regulator n=1 Tax=Pendulispora brunnea TaxID=2905690 RepID=A0ABZ2K6C8_9BACT
MLLIGSPPLDVRDLQVVLAIASAGSTAAASPTLNLTQSAVSRALSLAEERLGAPIFERTGRGLTPTPAGQRLIAGARPVLAQLAELVESARALAVAPTRLRIVCECYTAYRWLPSVLRRLHESYPKVDVTLAIEHTHDPVAALVAGEVDMALLTMARVRGRLRELPLFSDEVVFVVAASHPLAAQRSITARDLCEHLLISSHTPEAETRWFMTRLFGRRRPKLDFLRLPLTEAIVDAARAGMGIAVLSEWIASGYLDRTDLVAKRLSSAPLRRPWRLAFRDEVAGAAQRLASALERAAPHMYKGDARTRRTGDAALIRY